MIAHLFALLAMYRAELQLLETELANLQNQTTTVQVSSTPTYVYVPEWRWTPPTSTTPAQETQSPMLGSADETQTVALPSFVGSGFHFATENKTSSSISVYVMPGSLAGDDFSVTVSCSTDASWIGMGDCSSYVPQTYDITAYGQSNPFIVSGLVPNTDWRFLVTASNSAGSSTQEFNDQTTP